MSGLKGYLRTHERKLAPLPVQTRLHSRFTRPTFNPIKASIFDGSRPGLGGRRRASRRRLIAFAAPAPGPIGTGLHLCKKIIRRFAIGGNGPSQPNERGDFSTG